MLKILSIITFICLCLWLYLFVTSQAFLVSGKGPLRQEDHSADSLICTYFTGLGFIERNYWYAENDFMGKSACPRIIGFGE